MRCALVFYFVMTIFVVVYGLPDLCVFKDYEGKGALCGRHDVEHIFNFIPSISQHIIYIDLLEQPIKQLPYNAFRNLSSQSSISKIGLRYCEIGRVDARALLYLYNLTFIDLSHNDIKQIDSKLFSHTKQIKFIHMEDNKIEVLPEGLFQNLTLLGRVYLSDNRIRQVEWFSFQNTPSLRIIHLNNNKIEVMNMLFKDKFDNLTTLSLYDNPWKCICELGPLYELLIKINQLNQHGLVCEKPPTLQGRNWNDICRDKFVCRTENAISATEHDVNIPVTVYNVAISTRDSVMTSTESMTSTVQEHDITVTVYNATRCQVVSCIPQSPLIPNWYLYTIIGLVGGLLVFVIAVIIGVVCIVRYMIHQSDRRTNVPMQDIENGKNGDSRLSTDCDVDEESKFI